jgi:hypothetical protein
LEEAGISTGGFYKKIILFKFIKKIRERRKLSLIGERDKNSGLRRLGFRPETSTNNVIQEFHLGIPYIRWTFLPAGWEEM